MFIAASPDDSSAVPAPTKDLMDLVAASASSCARCEAPPESASCAAVAVSSACIAATSATAAAGTAAGTAVSADDGTAAHAVANAAADAAAGAAAGTASGASAHAASGDAVSAQARAEGRTSAEADRTHKTGRGAGGALARHVDAPAHTGKPAYWDRPDLRKGVAHAHVAAPGGTPPVGALATQEGQMLGDIGDGGGAH